VGYAISLISGLLFGVLVAWLKHVFIWRPFVLGRSPNGYWRMIASSAVNVFTLLLVYLLRNIWPYSFEFTILAAALGLAVGGRLIAWLVDKKGRRAQADTPMET